VAGKRRTPRELAGSRGANVKPKESDMDKVYQTFGVASAWAGVVFVAFFGACLLVAAWLNW